MPSLFLYGGIHMAKIKTGSKIVIGIDQSYTKTGISVCQDGELKMVTSTAFKGCETLSEKRKHIANIIDRLLHKASQKRCEVVIHVERIRTFSNFGGKAGGNAFGQGLKPDYLKKTAALIARIVDVAAEYDVPVYSIDTRSWKSKIVGNSKAKKKNGKRDAKSETVEYIQNVHGFDLFIKRSRPSKKNPNGVDVYDDDAADSACLALYGFLPKSQQNLKKEE